MVKCYVIGSSQGDVGGSPVCEGCSHVGVTCLEVDICYKELFGLIQNGSPCLASNGRCLNVLFECIPYFNNVL